MMLEQIQQLTSNIVQPLPSNITRGILCYTINIVGIHVKQFKLLMIKDITYGIQATQNLHNTMLLDNCVLYIYHTRVCFYILYPR